MHGEELGLFFPKFARACTQGVMLNANNNACALRKCTQAFFHEVTQLPLNSVTSNRTFNLAFRYDETDEA